jgi:hypothetical protein
MEPDPSPVSNLDKAALVQALVTRFGSRRAVIEEIDRRTRLMLLKPRERGTHYNGLEPMKGRTPTIKNEPNPEWRELDTPSLLMSPDESVEFQSLEAKFPITPDVILQVQRKPPNKPRKMKKREGKCKNCRCPLDDRTKGCHACTVRHSARAAAAYRRAQKVWAAEGLTDTP